jgi:hypothetical protein
MCRKAHAAPFASYVVGPRAAFKYTAGESEKAAYESSPGFTRSFCSQCGSVLPNTEFANAVAIPAGCLDGDPGIEATAHIFTQWKAPWHAITDVLPRHDNYPGQTAPPVDRAPREPSGDDVLRGSCLCGDAAFEVLAPFIGVHNCHCRRCRKARAAAHTTNGFTAIDKVRYTRGEEQLKTFRVSNARYFAQTFCRRCGSGMPRLDTERRIAIVPFGVLDDDPGRGADDHIFVGSKSSWYPITDELPQFEEQATS